VEEKAKDWTELPMKTEEVPIYLLASHNRLLFLLFHLILHILSFPLFVSLFSFPTRIFMALELGRTG